MRKILLMLLCIGLAGSQLFAQTRTLTGRVADAAGNPLVGATVALIGGGGNATTNASGVFTLVAPASARQLEITYVGFATQRVTIGNTTTFNLTLAPSNAGLDEVIVTGYGRVKKSTFSGAATRIDKKAIEAVPMASFEQMLQGRSPGLLVTSGSGQPGAAARVQIRGATSVTGGSTPLYIVDGVPVEAGVFQSYNPNDFESVDVLKDASSQALYGSRGAAGVIVVTTKRGKAGKTSFLYRGQTGVTQTGTQQFEMMNTAELLQFQEKLGLLIPGTNLPGWTNSRLNPTYATATAAVRAQRDRNLDSLNAINVDWTDVFFRKGTFNSHDIQLSGGSDRTRFFLATGLYDEQGIAERSDLTRYTFRTNVDHTTDRLTLGLNTTFGYTKRNFIESEGAVALANPFAAAYLGVPYQKLYNDNGTIATGGGRVGPNAFQRIRDIDRFNNQLKTTLSTNVNYRITDQIYAGGSAGLDFRETDNVTYVKPETWTANTSAFPTGPLTAGGRAGGSYSTSLGRYLQYQGRAFIGYRNVFAEKHSFDISANAEYIKEKNSNFGYTGYGLNAKLIGTPAAITQGTVANQLIPVVSGGKTQRAYQSLFAVAKYTFDDKYTLDFSARRDGVSILPEKNRFQNFYAVGANWNVMREGFATNWKNISSLRLRASYGNSANAANYPLGDFGYLATYVQGSLAGNPTLVANNPGNPEAEWEYTTQANVGLDFGFFRERITGTLDVYNKITNNAFISQSLSFTSGFGAVNVNAGEVRNRGVELSLNVDVIRTQNFNWNIGGNVSYNENEVTDLGQVSEFEQGTSIIRKGLPLGSHYVVKWGGVDAATGQDLYYTKDGKLTNMYSASNSVADFGTFNAPWIGGFNTSVRFKGFDITAFFTFQQGFSRFNNQDFFQLNHAFAQQGFNLRKEMLNMWTKPGDVTDIQSPLTQRQFSSKDIQDASYLRFRNLTASYSLPRSIIEKQKFVTNLRIFGQAQNLYTWTKWTGFDPEDNNNIAQYEYPTPRIYTLGVEVQF